MKPLPLELLPAAWVFAAPVSDAGRGVRSRWNVSADAAVGATAASSVVAARTRSDLRRLRGRAKRTPA
jgi:hypothetical protein